VTTERAKARAKRHRKIITLLKGGSVLKAAELSAAVGVSVRSIYRSIVTLREKGHRIDGEAGVGYMLRRAA